MRNQDRLIRINDHELYRDVFVKKNLTSNTLRQYVTAQMKYPTEEQISKLNLIQHVWTRGDKFYKLAQEHYGDPSLWFVIAWFNKKPTEHHFVLGEILYVPLPLNSVLRIMGV
jgi:nucleoid-associated protein YgaU